MKTKINASVLTKKGNWFEVMLPAKRIICPRCDGVGKHDHPAFANGVDSEHLQDPDFNEAYMRGDYDTRCYRCDGEKIILEVDIETLSPKMRDRFYLAIAANQDDERELAMERRMGC